jgi:hypothetical protein
MSFVFPQTITPKPIIINNMKVRGLFNENGLTGVQVTLFDSKGRIIPPHLIPNVPPPTAAQLAAMNAIMAKAGESPIHWINRVTEPYIAAAYGFTVSTPTGTSGSSGGVTGATGISESMATAIPGIVGPGVPH